MESYSIGTIFDYQGRYGAAGKSKGEALQAFRDLKQQDFWLGEILSGLGYSLALGGRADEASKSLDEALALARELKHSGLTAQVLRFQAETAFFKGDAASAGAAQRRGPSSGSERFRSVDGRLGAVRRGEHRGRGDADQGGGGDSRADWPASEEAPAWPTSPSTARCSRPTPCSGAATISRRACWRKTRWPEPRRWGFASCGREANTSSPPRCGLAGDAQARRHYTTALQLLEEMAREDGSQKLLERADLKAIHAECVRWSKTP